MGAPLYESACGHLGDFCWRNPSRTGRRCRASPPCETECAAAARPKTRRISRKWCRGSFSPLCASACVSWCQLCWTISRRCCTSWWDRCAGVHAAWVNTCTGIPCCTGYRWIFVLSYEASGADKSLMGWWILSRTGCSGRGSCGASCEPSIDLDVQRTFHTSDIWFLSLWSFCSQVACSETFCLPAWALSIYAFPYFLHCHFSACIPSF